MTRHIERKRNISNKVYMRFFGLRPLNDDIYLGLVPSQTPHQIFFLYWITSLSLVIMEKYLHEIVSVLQMIQNVQ